MFGGQLAGLLFKPHTILLVAINSILVYHLIGKYYPKVPAFVDTRSFDNGGTCSQRDLPPLPYRDYLISELAEFDGVRHERILVAIDMRIFDVTKARNLYGPGGSYDAFAGRDASRSLAIGRIWRYPKGELQEYDYLTDLAPKERDRLNAWVEYYDRRYDLVGTLLPFHMPAQSGDEGGPRTGTFLPED